MFKSITLAAVLLTLSSVASASSSKCETILWFTFCGPFWGPTPVNAPEIDPASAMSGLTLLAGGLVVLRGRRRR